MTQLLHRIAENPFSWIDSDHELGDVIKVGAIQLRRNIKGFPFPHKASEKSLKATYKCINEAAAKSSLLKDWKCYNALNSNAHDWHMLCRETFLSNEIMSSRSYNEIKVSPSTKFTIRINNEEHLQLHHLESGPLKDSAWQEISQIDDEFSEHLEFAYSHDQGYFSSQIKNLGTGLEAYQVLSLPGLTLSYQLPQVANALKNMSLKLEPLFGSMNNSSCYYILSNETSSGMREAEIISKVRESAMDLREKELRARENLLNEDPYALIHRVSTSFGLLKYSFYLPEETALLHLSDLMVGIDFNLFSKLSPKELRRLIRSSFSYPVDGEEDANDCDYERAKMVRDYLKNI